MDFDLCYFGLLIILYIVRFLLFTSDTVISPNSRTSQMSDQRPFHLSQAVLNVAPNVSSYNQVWVQCNNKMALIAILSGSVNQVRLDLAFGQEDVVTFYNKGDSDVHLSGYYLLEYGEQQEETSKQNLSKENRFDNPTWMNSGFENSNGIHIKVSIPNIVS